MGMDLGVVNFALAVVDGQRSGKFAVQHAVMLQHMVQDITELAYARSYRRFRQEVQTYIDQWQPDVIVLERFMNRGRFNGASGEKINIMIAIVTALAFRRGIMVVLVSASTWKNRFQHLFGRSLKEVYANLRPVPPHFVDAHLQAIYGLRKLHAPQENPYEHWRMKIGQQLLLFWQPPARKPRKKKYA